MISRAALFCNIIRSIVQVSVLLTIFLTYMAAGTAIKTIRIKRAYYGGGSRLCHARSK